MRQLASGNQPESDLSRYQTVKITLAARLIIVGHAVLSSLDRSILIVIVGSPRCGDQRNCEYERQRDPAQHGHPPCKSRTGLGDWTEAKRDLFPAVIK
jgi:hypothetical protein